MPRTTDPRKTEQARQLELSGLTRQQIADEMGVHLSTVKRWLSRGVTGRPRIPDGEPLSERTRYRRQAEARGGLAGRLDKTAKR